MAGKSRTGLIVAIIIIGIIVLSALGIGGFFI